MKKTLIFSTIVMSFLNANVDSLLKNECLSYVYVEAETMNTLAEYKDIENKKLTNVELSKQELESFLNTSFSKRKFFPNKNIKIMEDMLNNKNIQNICTQGNNFNQKDYSKHMRNVKIGTKRIEALQDLNEVFIVKAVFNIQAKVISKEKYRILESDFKSYYISKLYYLTKEMSVKEINSLANYIKKHPGRNTYRIFRFL